MCKFFFIWIYGMFAFNQICKTSFDQPMDIGQSAKEKFLRRNFRTNVCHLFVSWQTLPGLQKRVLKRDFFLNVLLVLVRTFINELSKKYGTVKFDLRASLKFGFEWYTAYFSLVPRSSVPRSLFPYVPHSSSTS